MHWNGSRWSRVTMTDRGALFNYIYAVAAVSSNDVWAVGNNDYPPGTLIEHYATVPCVTATATTTPPTSTRTPTRTVTPTRTPTCGLGGPDYLITQSTGASMVLGTTDTGNHCDDCTTGITLPFTYYLYGQAFNTADVDSNGTLDFTTTSRVLTNTCLPTNSYNNTIFAHWDNLRTDQVNP